MPDNRIIRIGVLGRADIARRQVIPAILAMPGQYAFAGVASRDLSSGTSNAYWDALPAYHGYDSILNRDLIEAIYIPLPNSLHAEWIEKALNRDIHVLVEKSMTCSLAETERLNRLARNKGLVLVENFQFRFHRQMSVLQQILADGGIGELRCLRSSFGFPPFADKNNIRYQKSLGGGALLDAGAYPIKAAQIFLGPELTVKAARLHNDLEYGVDTWGGGFIAQKNGDLFMEFAFGFDHHYQCNLELWGSRGKLTATRIFTAPPGFSPVIEWEHGSGKETISVEPDNHFQRMLEHFHKLIADPSLAESEYRQNISQATLIEEYKMIANAR